MEGQYDGGSNNAQSCQDCDYPAHFGMQLHGPVEGYWVESISCENSPKMTKKAQMGVKKPQQ